MMSMTRLRMPLGYALLTVLLWIGHAISQGSPGLYYGQVPTAEQWNGYFASKLDLTKATGTLAGYADGINCNAAGDTLVPVYSPAANWMANGFIVFMTAGAGGSARIGVYSGPNQTGLVIAAQQALGTAAGPNTPGAEIGLSLTAGTYYNYQNLYVNVGTAQGSACVFNIYMNIRQGP